MNYNDELMSRLNLYKNQEQLHRAILDELGDYIAGHAKAQHALTGSNIEHSILGMLGMVEVLLVTINDIGLPPKIVDAVANLGAVKHVNSLTPIQALFSVVKSHHDYSS